MLELALCWGIGFILLAGAITIRNLVAARRYAEALLDANGAMGMLFYVGLLYGGSQLVRHGGVNVVGLLAMGLPLAVILWRIWQANRAGPVNASSSLRWEGLERRGLMRYIANTLSFLRVAAFSLNHVALSVAIYMLAGMIDTQVTGALSCWVMSSCWCWRAASWPFRFCAWSTTKDFRVFSAATGGRFAR